MHIRFSVLPYVNALPLVHFLVEVYPQAECVSRIPRVALDALLSGQVDVALVPVADYLRCPEVRAVQGLGICAEGDVTSVLLQCRRPLEMIRTVRLDPESRSSNTLVQVLMRDYFRTRHRVRYLQNGVPGDAQVCIGDRALCSPPAMETYDLAGAWKEMTGLPFVFAVWVVRSSCPKTEAIAEILHGAKNRGCRSIERLTMLAADRLKLPPDRCRDYLERRLHYDVGPRECQAIDLFRRLSTGTCDVPAGKTITPIPLEAGT